MSGVTKLTRKQFFRLRMRVIKIMKVSFSVLLIVLTLCINAQTREVSLSMHAGVNYGKLIDKDFKIKQREPGYLITASAGYNLNGCTGFAAEFGYEKKNSRQNAFDENINLNYYNFRLLFSGYFVYGAKGIMNVNFGGFYNQLAGGNSIISKSDYGLSVSLSPGIMLSKKIILESRFRYEKGLKNIYAPEPKIRVLRSSYFSVSGGITFFL